MSFFTELLADVLALPVTLASEAVNSVIKTVEAAPAVAERAFEKIEDAFDRIGS